MSVSYKTSVFALISILRMCMLLIPCYWYIENSTVVDTTTCKRSTENHFCQEYSSFIIYHLHRKPKYPEYDINASPIHKYEINHIKVRIKIDSQFERLE